MKKTIFLNLVLLSGLSNVMAEKPLAKFEPPADNIIVFVGQDNASVGGTAEYKNGYVDNIGVPGGITHYIYFAEGWENNFGYTMPKGSVAGLNSETTWGAGPMNMKAYMDSPVLKDCVFHLSISMEGNNEDRVADGSMDHFIDELVAFLSTYKDRVFLIRIGYEFDGSWNKYDTENFKKAFIRIVDRLREAQLTNFATVMASSGGEKYQKWDQYYPGDDYVDWVGYSYFISKKKKRPLGQSALRFAREHNKPVFIAEATPRGTFIDKTEGPEVWNAWYEGFFQHIEENKDVIHAISYINCHWDKQPMWDKWGNSRLEENDYVRKQWLQKMSEPQLVNAADKPVNFYR